jgi:glutathione S-transferase
MASSERASPAAAAESGTAAEEKTLRIVRTFEAPIEMVFEAWTVPEQIVQWWGPEGHHVPEYRIDMRAGGAWRTVMRDADGGDHIVSGVIHEISPPSRLVFSWAWETDGVRGHETVIAIELRALGEDRTELTLTQREFETKESCELHSLGWNSSFDCLDTYLDT